MKKIFSSLITLIAEIVAIAVACIWFVNSLRGEFYEPLILLVISVASFITTWVLRTKTAEAGDEIGTQNIYNEYHHNTTFWDRIIQDISFFELFEKIKEKSRGAPSPDPNPDYYSYNDPYIPDIDGIESINPDLMPQDLPDIKEALTNGIADFDLYPDSITDIGDIDTSFGLSDLIDNIT